MIIAMRLLVKQKPSFAFNVYVVIHAIFNQQSLAIALGMACIYIYHFAIVPYQVEIVSATT